MPRSFPLFGFAVSGNSNSPQRGNIPFPDFKLRLKYCTTIQVSSISHPPCSNFNFSAPDLQNAQNLDNRALKARLHYRRLDLNQRHNLGRNRIRPKAPWWLRNREPIPRPRRLKSLQRSPRSLSRLQTPLFLKKQRHPRRINNN